MGDFNIAFEEQMDSEVTTEYADLLEKLGELRQHEFVNVGHLLGDGPKGKSKGGL